MIQCETVSDAGFVQQVAQAYIPRGYRYFAVRLIPKSKDPVAVDKKLLELYEVDITKSKRHRRKRAGLSNVRYCRRGHFALLVATPQWVRERRGGKEVLTPKPGGHVFFEECPDYRDFRQDALRFGGYEIQAKHSTRDGKWHASVRIEEQRWRELRGHFREIALRRGREELEQEFRRLPFEPWAPVAKQYRKLLWEIRERRAAAGFSVPSWRCIRMRRRSVQPFGSPDDVPVSFACEPGARR